MEGWIDEDGTWRRFPIGRDIPLKRLVLEVVAEEAMRLADGFESVSARRPAGVNRRLRGKARTGGAGDFAGSGRRRPDGRGQRAASSERRWHPRAASEERGDLVQKNVTITAAQAAFIREHAFLREVPMSLIVREALNEEMARQPKLLSERRWHPRAASEERGELVQKNVTITAAQAAFIREHAFLREVPMSLIVREALNEMMANAGGRQGMDSRDVSGRVQGPA
jgi:hypothetical protein